MIPPRPAEILSVRPGSKAEAAGLTPGERVLRVNGRAPADYIEYRYLAAEPQIRLTVLDTAGRRRRITIHKALDEDLGLRFTSDLFDGLLTCRNRCAFCFVDQLPPGLRPALYLHDDDYRLSFLHGAFVTLTNLTPAHRARIARLRLSPLYVSIHATEPEVRATLFGRPTPDPRREIERLGRRGIEFHTQVVLCPGVNDGIHLARTITDLAALHPAVRSIGVVPVGLTRHRRGLPRVRPVSPRLARETLARLRRWQRSFLRQLGTRLVFAADELYLLAGEPLPAARHYEGFPQLANGIGGVRLFRDSVRRLRPLALARPLGATLVTGELAAPFVLELARKLEAGGRVTARVCVVPNRLLGRRVGVAGLLSGRDVLHALRGTPPGDVVFVPGTAIREGEGFLDGMTTERLSQQLGVPVVPATAPRQVTAALRRLARRGGRV